MRIIITWLDQLIRHFEKFGNVENCQYIQVMNFAIVTFSEKGVTENALRSPHVIMGREVNCRLYCDKLEDLASENSQGTMFRTEKIFVGNLPTTCSQDILRKYFQQFGQISDCVMMCDKKSGIGRGKLIIALQFEQKLCINRLCRIWICYIYKHERRR